MGTGRYLVCCHRQRLHRKAPLLNTRAEEREHLLITAVNANIAIMAAITIRQLDEKTKSRLRIRAAHHGRSMEEEAREILRSALAAVSSPRGNLAEAIRRRFAPFGGLELELPRRDSLRQPPEFSR
jgi:antitoxin FitA